MQLQVITRGVSHQEHQNEVASFEIPDALIWKYKITEQISALITEWDCCVLINLNRMTKNCISMNKSKDGGFKLILG